MLEVIILQTSEEVEVEVEHQKLVQQ